MKQISGPADAVQARREIRAWLTDCTPPQAAREGLMDAYLTRCALDRATFVAMLIDRLVSVRIADVAAGRRRR